MMKNIQSAMFVLLVAMGVGACVPQPAANSNNMGTTSPSPISSPAMAAAAETRAIPVTLPVLDALFGDEAFKTELKSKVELTEEQISELRKTASEEVARLRRTNAEEQGNGAAQARQGAAEAISRVVGDEKSQKLIALARERWVAGDEELEAGKTKAPEDTMLPGPNAVPKDTRVVVNIPAFRMDVFEGASLIKSYKVGIGYPAFPLPTGLRKAQTIIFNPTWTPPDEPWVAKMKNINVGEKVEAGSALNPLGPIKIPIGMPSLIHGGKSPAKLGTFASHGCVGLTTAQVKDFAKLLAKAGGTEITDKSIESHLKDKTKTRVVKLERAIPVELRYETIVVEDGKLHIYRDVYDQDTNTEENLRTVLEVNGVRLEDLTADERAQVMDALNAMSRHPQKLTTASPSNTASPVAGTTTKAEDKKLPAKTAKKPIGKNQKEVVIEIATLKGKGYPAPVNLDTGTGKPAAVSAQSLITKSVR